MSHGTHTVAIVTPRLPGKDAGWGGELGRGERSVVVVGGGGGSGGGGGVVLVVVVVVV